MAVTIVPFKPEYAPIFKDLNIAWVEKYFYVEEQDVLLLENCQFHIIDKGGYIFFADYDAHLVGCFSLIPIENSIFELGKMAVDPNFQGLKIGQRLLSFAIDFARRKGWEKLILYSSTKLDTALHIYRKFGFKEVHLDAGSPYKRSDIKMELSLR